MTAERHRRRIALWAALLALFAIGLAACDSEDSADGAGNGGGGSGSEEAVIEDWGGTINPGGTPVKGGALRIDQALAPEAISSLGYIDDSQMIQNLQVLMTMFDQLVELMPGSIEPRPGLAEEWEISEDGKTYTFQLREAEFSNGLPVTSADVKYSLGRLLKSFYASNFTAVSAVKAPDPKTVVIELSKPMPGLIDYLAFPGASIVPAKVVKEMGDDAYKANPIGSGPFKLERWRRDQDVVVVRNERYWGEAPHLDEIRFNATPDANTRILNVQSGEADVADLVPFAQIETINNSGDASVLVIPGADMNVMFINNSKEPFGEPEVRQALNYATPVESIIDVVFRGEAQRMNTITPKLKYWTDKAKAFPHDSERAKELLAESSVPNGFSTTLTIAAGDPASEQVAQIIKEAWQEIGVKVTIKPMEAASASAAYSSGKYELYYPIPGVFTSDVTVDDQMTTFLFNSADTNNLFTYYDNPTTKDLVARAVSETDEDTRAQLFEELHVESMKNPPVVPITYTPNRAAVRSDVHDLSYLLNGWWRFERTWVE